MSTKKLKVMTIIGTRPEIIRLCEVIKACDKEFEQILVHTGRTMPMNSMKFSSKSLDFANPIITLKP